MVGNYGVKTSHAWLGVGELQVKTMYTYVFTFPFSLRDCSKITSSILSVSETHRDAEDGYWIKM